MYKNLIGRKVLVRSVEAGVYYGTLVDVDGNNVAIKQVKNLWSWSGANNLLELALRGAANPKACRYSVTVDEVIIAGVCEIVPCTDQAIENIENTETWKY